MSFDVGTPNDAGLLGMEFAHQYDAHDRLDTPPDTPTPRSPANRSPSHSPNASFTETLEIKTPWS